MKTAVISSILFLAASASAAPAPTQDPYEPAGGWGSIDWTKVKYPPGTGENFQNYPPPPGGWENVKYPTDDDLTVACPPNPLQFTSTFHVIATPDQVVNDTTPTGGLPGAIGYYDLGINSDHNVICYTIRLVNFQGDYESPANTATHIHEAAAGQSGPPRIAFPNPQGDGAERTSMGCLQGPFTTGVLDEETGEDTGLGFTVSQIEENPGVFMADVHSSLAVPGAVRGQIGTPMA